MEQNFPTVLPASPFDPEADAKELLEAMRGLGTDEEALIRILCRRTSAQRAQIGEAFNAANEKDLESKLKSETSGYFKKLLVALSLPTADFLAREMHKAMEGAGTKEETLVEILCSRSNKEICDMKAAYQRMYGRSLEQDIEGDTSGTLEMFLSSLAQGHRDENYVVDPHRVKDDAARLHEAGVASWGTDERTFNNILITRSWPHLRQLKAEYQELAGQSLEDAVNGEFSSYEKEVLLAILQCANSKAEYFAHRLRTALSGAGTKDRTLIRIVVTRSDIDLGNIKREYEKLFESSLVNDVTDDTSSDYKNALLALLG